MSDSTFTWGTVTSLGPLRVQLDGDATPLLITPDTLVDPLSLAVSDRVRCELAHNRLIVHGHAGGSIRSASSTLAGLVELATPAEARAGTSSLLAVTPEGLRAASIPLQGQTPSSIVVGSGSASAAADGTVTCTAVSSLALNGVFDGLGGDGYEVFGVLVAAGDIGGSLWLRHRGGGVDVTTGHYYMEGGGLATSWAGYTTRGSVASNAGGFLIGFRQYSSFRIQVLRPNQAQPKEVLGLLGSDGTNQVAGWTWGRTSFSTAQDGLKIFAQNSSALTGWVKVVKTS